MPDPGVGFSSPYGGSYTELRSAISQAMNGANVISVSYVGRDTGGRPIYRIRTQANLPAGTRTGTYSGFQGSGGPIRVQTLVFQNGRLDNPFTDERENVTGAGSAAGQQSEAEALRRVKDRWLAWVSNLHPTAIHPTERANFISMISGYTGSAQTLDDRMRVASNNLAFDSSAEAPPQPDEFDWGNLFGGGGGGGGGFAGPVYRAPDRRVVEDMAKGIMTSLVGNVLEDKLDAAVNLYMADHRRNFDSENKEIDPAQSMLEFIRDTKAYKTIHQLRPDSEDERSWVSNRRQAVKQGGLDQSLQEDAAIDLATAGVTEEDAVEGGAFRQIAMTGEAPNLIKQRFGGAVAAMLQGVR